MNKTKSAINISVVLPTPLPFSIPQNKSHRLISPPHNTASSSSHMPMASVKVMGVPVPGTMGWTHVTPTPAIPWS